MKLQELNTVRGSPKSNNANHDDRCYIELVACTIILLTNWLRLGI